MGVTALWVSPVFKQVAFHQDSYHGYGIQNFLAVDPHFGDLADLQELVSTAHRDSKSRSYMTVWLYPERY
jgi:glycosidase